MRFLDPQTKLISYGFLQLSFYDLLFLAFVLVFALFRHMILKWSALSPEEEPLSDIPTLSEDPLSDPLPEPLSLSLVEKIPTPEEDPMDALRLD